MATSQEYMEFVAEQLADTGHVRYRKMFGEYMVYLDDKPVVLVCDETPFVKKLPCLEELMAGAACKAPYDGAKEHYILDIEDPVLVPRVIEKLLNVTPVPKPKAKKTAPAVGADAVEDYIRSQRDDIQPLLRQVYDAIGSVLPEATVKISWQMPTFWQATGPRSGRNLVHFAAQKHHLGLYPGVAAMEHFQPRLTDYKVGKGSIQFPYKGFGAEQLALIAEIAAWCSQDAGNTHHASDTRRGTPLPESTP